MLEKQFIQDYFNADFRGIDSLLNDVLVPIFGAFNPGYDEITLSRDAKEKAAQSRIKKIKHVATLPAMGMDIKVFDVTLDSRCHIHRARKGIQMLIRQYVEKFEGAFIVFHYEAPANRSWRFSYLEKRESNVASTNAKRYTYLCGKQYPCRTLAERFEGLQKQDLTAINLEKAFSVETLSDEFFNEYRNFYQDLVNFVRFEDNLIDGFVEYAKGDKELAEKYARDYIKKLMGRLVFIQFLQNKAWLKEDIHYTHTLFNSCTEEQKYDFLDNVLEPLFFGVFNTPKDAREVLFHQKHWDMNLYNEWKDFPYLNGGLFECDELDKLSLPLPSYFFSNLGKEDKVRKPNDEFYSDACGIFDFFDRYNFTIDESDPLDREIGVDPEMLGKIFENLLEDNKDKGAFYTPKEIVDYMCKEALTAYLIDEARKKSEVNKQRQENFEDAIRAFVNDPEMTVKRIQQYDDKQLIDLDESLRDVKICDPAIGSGAFPMGLLNLLMACRTAVNDALHKGEPRYLLKKEIIQNNIYGVDIEKGAIDIARLRFWLSIVVDLEEPEALPNFDYKFMQGNSLLEQYKGVDLSTLTQNKKEQHEALQVSMFDDQLDILRKTLRKYLDDYFLTTDHQIKTRLRQQIKDNVNQQLHEQHIRVDFPEQYDIAANTDFFLWHTWFADVFNRPSKQGFDIVIGNPPYVEAKKLKHIASNLKHYRVASGTADLSIYFAELALNLCKNIGIMFYITTNKFYNTGFGKPLRKYLLEKNITHLIDFEQCEVFENVLVSSVILGVENRHYEKDNKFLFHRFYKLNHDDFKIEFVSKQRNFKSFVQANLDEQEWSFATGKKADLKKKLDTFPKVKDLEGVSVYRGVTTGYNPAFIISDEKRDQLIAADPNNAKIIKNMLQGRNIRKWYYNESDENLLQTGYDTNIKGNYSLIYNHLVQFKSELEIRSDQGKKWYNLRACKYYEEFEKSEKIIWGLTADKWAFTLDTKQHYLPSNGYIMTSNSLPIRYLLGLLNSKALHYYFGFIGVMTAGGAYTLKAATIEAMPIPSATPAQQQPIIDLVDTILAKKKQNPQADTSVEESAIDQLVYKLYELSEDEIKLIEKE